MPKKQGKQNREHLVVSIVHVHANYIEMRLSRAIDILLEGMTWEPTDHEDSVKSEVKAAKAGKLTKRSKKVQSRKCCSSKNIIGGKT